MQPTNLSVIEGGGEEHEQLFQRLLSEPHTFEQAEFENLIDVTFRSRLKFEDIAAIIETRMRRRDYGDATETSALLAIMEGNHDEAAHLTDVLARRNSLRLKVI